MILAAGRGERMRPLTDTVPKPLLCVGGKPLIVWHIERLAKAGISEIVINHAWLGEQIESLLGDGINYGVDIAYSREEGAGLETAGGIRTALPLLGERPFIVVNADVFTDYPFATLEDISLTQNRLAHLVMVDKQSFHPKGDWGIHEGFADQQAEPYYVLSGIGLYHPALFEEIAINERAKLAPLLRQQMLKNLITAEYYAGLWLDIGTEERLAAANDYIVMRR